MEHTFIRQGLCGLVDLAGLVQVVSGLGEELLQGHVIMHGAAERERERNRWQIWKTRIRLSNQTRKHTAI